MGVRPSESENSGAVSVPPSEGNEARWDGRHGVGVVHCTGEAGEPTQWDPVEGRDDQIMEPMGAESAGRLGDQEAHGNPTASTQLEEINPWCRANRHLPIAEQARHLAQKLRGHYGYYGVTTNGPSRHRFYEEVRKRWRRWLSRRSQRGFVPWRRMQAILQRYPLPQPRVLHRAVLFQQ